MERDVFVHREQASHGQYFPWIWMFCLVQTNTHGSALSQPAFLNLGANILGHIVLCWGLSWTWQDV